MMEMETELLAALIFYSKVSLYLTFRFLCLKIGALEELCFKIFFFDCTGGG